jgi:hypothetical protein
MADDLTREEFDVLARRAGFDPADAHMDDLFPDVQAMLRRVALMDGTELTGEDPAGAGET